MTKKAKSTRGKKALLSAADACRILGVKPQTLYAYVSRGQLTSEPARDGRGSLYPRVEIETLKARARARSGHGPTAAGALRWGDPVLESSIACIQDGMLFYRGRALKTLLERGLPFENVAELLWSGDLPERAVHWDVPKAKSEVPGGDETRALGRRLSSMIARRALHDTDVLDERLDLTLARARSVIFACGREFLGAADIQGTLSQRIATGIYGDALPEAETAINAALVASTDHELNPSTFGARIAASTGADLYACFQAAMAAFSGKHHGLSPVEVAEAVAALKSDRDVKAQVHACLRQNQLPLGFGHRLYPEGDPRAMPLIDAAGALAQRRGSTSARTHALVRTMIAMLAQESDARPNIDLGLVAVASALGLGTLGASSLFALGRMAGWTAHILEQRQQDFMLRPRARYVGRRPEY